MRRIPGFWSWPPVLLCWLGFGSAALLAQGFHPAAAERHLRPAEGIEVALVAAEPLVRQPVAIEFDDRGRLWVIQYLQYPNPAGLERVRVDRYSRTVYDRVPEPPPRGPRGEDRVTILEDADGDGRLDRGKDFLSGLNLASGIAFGRGGVFIAQAPYLLFYPDRNQDDVPDADPQVLLEGFGMEDASSVVNSLTWGPDGWLYGAQGSTVTANIRGMVFQQGVWRYHVEGDRFEIFHDGGGNTWGLDFDAQGHLFASTNVGGYVLLHGLQGASYWKQFEKHGPLRNAHAYGHLEHVAYADFRGGHVSAGGVIYDGDSFPASHRGTYVAANVLSHAVHWHELVPTGSTFEAFFGGELLAAEDTWVAPCDIALGPDGAILVADWYDARTAHPDPDATWDRSNGRIYRLQARNAPRQVVKDVSRLASVELVSLLQHTNGWLVERARRCLQERRDASVVPRLRELATGGAGRAALEALWVLSASGGLDQSTAEKLLRHADAAVRAWTVRAAAEGTFSGSGFAGRWLELARTDPSAFVRVELIGLARQLRGGVALEILRALVARDVDATDPCIPLLLWWAIEERTLVERRQILALFANASTWQLPMAQVDILPRLVRRWAAAGDAESLEGCARILEEAPTTADRLRLVVALDLGLKAPGDHGPGARLTTLCRLSASEQLDEPIFLRVLVKLGDAHAHEEALRLAEAASAPLVLRRGAWSALAALPLTRKATALEPAFRVLGNETDHELQALALDCLGRDPQPEVGARLLKLYARWRPALQTSTRQLLLSRPEWTRLLLDAVERREIAAGELPPDEIRRIAAHNDAGLDARARRLWGSFRSATPEEKLAEVRRHNNDLRAAPGDAVRGHELFARHCGTCHQLFGEGKSLGPELTLANRQDRDFLLVSTVDPNAQIRQEYLAHTITTIDGRVITGRIVAANSDPLEILDAAGATTRIARADISDLKESTTSLMPEGLLSKLTPQELRDLFAYLEGPPPVK